MDLFKALAVGGLVGGLFILLFSVMESCSKEDPPCYDCKAYYNDKWLIHDVGDLAFQQEQCSDLLVISFYSGWNHPFDTLGTYVECNLN
jgi:hypothetical protein